MPFNLGITELGLVVAVFGVMAAVGYKVVKFLGRGGVSREELEAEKRDLERRIEAVEERERLPKG